MGLGSKVLLAGSGIAAYAAHQARSYRIRSQQVPVPASGTRLTILQISDVHMTGRHRKLAAWLRALAHAIPTPDVIVASGDLIDDDSGIDPLIDACCRLEAKLGRFYVLGSHDYFQSTVRGFVQSLGKLFSIREPSTVRPADTNRLERGLQSCGWISLTNTAHVLPHDAGPVRLAGVDDPFIHRHQTEHIRRSTGDGLAVGVTHTPDVVSEWILAGFDLVLAGHTHGGQVRIPGLGALVTNCSLPSALASGLSQIGSGRLHVSPGLGTSKFSPVRLFCPPEVTLLTLVPSG
jgi:predicted MPP superfamily phosphohydrolase